jgi:5-methylcytosine-specific restriction endonuclease McrA
MPVALPKACIGCNRTCERDALRNGRCPECAKPLDAKNDRYRKNDPIRQMYLLARFGWRKFRAYIITRNPVCQRIVTNPLTFHQEQCREPAVEVHHLISPRTRPDLFTEPANVVCLCKHCHTKTQGEPEGKRDPQKYVPTMAGFGATGGLHEAN